MKLGAKTPKVKVPKVPVPRNNPTGRVRPPLGFPRPPIARIKKTSTRDYGKTPQISDNGLSSGFGDTGLTGES